MNLTLEEQEYTAIRGILMAVTRGYFLQEGPIQIRVPKDPKQRVLREKHFKELRSITEKHFKRRPKRA